MCTRPRHRCRKTTRKSKVFSMYLLKAKSFESRETMAMGGDSSSKDGSSIDSSNIGFLLLKKHGWKEGTGLGASEQGRLEPVQAYLKNNKRGLGADKVKMAAKKSYVTAASSEKNDQKCKTLSKRMRKMQELEKQLQEKEFERAFYREFWPDNV